MMVKQLTAGERYERYEASGKNDEYRKTAWHYNRVAVVPQPAPRQYGVGR